MLGEKDTLSRLEWKKVKGAFAAYRAWVAAKPVMNAGKKGELDDEERVLRYKLHLVEFLENYVKGYSAARSNSIRYRSERILCASAIS